MPARERGKWSAEAIRRALKLYAVTDNAWLGERTLTECVEEALAGGATFVQLRDSRQLARRFRPRPRSCSRSVARPACPSS